MTEITDNFNEPLSSSNCSTNQHDNEQIEKPSLLCLNDDVLLHVFSYLDLSDSINLAETCVRLHDLSCWIFKKGVELDTEKYSDKGSLPLQKILNSIAPHVQVLKARLSQLSNYDMNVCVNVKSLHILWNGNNYLDVTRINGWISKLNLESIWFMDFNSNTKTFHKLFNGITTVRELRINDETIECREFVSRNTNIERLSLKIQDNFKHTFNFKIFSKLHHLKSLHLSLYDAKSLNIMTRFGNFNGLTEFSSRFPFTCDGRWNLSEVNTFLKYLAENTKLDKLRVYGGEFSKDSFTTLKLMNLSALSLCCPYDRDVFTNFILEYSAPQLKHLQIRSCSLEQFENMVGKWKNLETICLYTDCEDIVQKCLDEALIEEILKLSTDRPMLTLHVDSYHLRDHQRPCHIKVCFKSQTFTKNYGIKTCFMSTAFGFSDNDCNRWC